MEEACGPHRAGTTPDEGSAGGLDPMAISNPASAYFLLSDDAQDEISGSDKKKMKCRACRHQFMGEIYDRYPECFSFDTEKPDRDQDLLSPLYRRGPAGGL
jgi:hypothetical protein